MLDVLQGKVAVVTGASAGMGAAIAEKLASAGATLVLAARRKDRLDVLAKRLIQDGTDTLAIALDVSQYCQVKSLVDAAIEKFGRIDVMVNNAGYGLLKPFIDSSIEEIDSQIDVNLKGVCYGCHAVLPHMLKQGGGHIINIGSIASMRHFPNFGVYTAAKFGVLGVTRAVYEEVRQKGIRMNVICPAAVNTEFLDVAGLENPPWKAEEMIQAEDIAELVYTCITLPSRIQVESIVLWPTCQATA